MLSSETSRPVGSLARTISFLAISILAKEQVSETQTVLPKGAVSRAKLHVQVSQRESSQLLDRHHRPQGLSRRA